MLNNGVDIFSLQRLMGHKDISILRRYLAQTTEAIRVAHGKGSPVENSPGLESMSHLETQTAFLSGCFCIKWGNKSTIDILGLVSQRV